MDFYHDRDILFIFEKKKKEKQNTQSLPALSSKRVARIKSETRKKVKEVFSFRVASSRPENFHRLEKQRRTENERNSLTEFG